MLSRPFDIKFKSKFVLTYVVNNSMLSELSSLFCGTIHFYIKHLERNIIATYHLGCKGIVAGNAPKGLLSDPCIKLTTYY